MHSAIQTKPLHLLEQVFAFDNDTWRVIGIGNADADGFTFFHFASTTRFRQQRNGYIPVQICDWMHPDMLQACAASSEAA